MFMRKHKHLAALCTHQLKNQNNFTFYKNHSTFLFELRSKVVHYCSPKTFTIHAIFLYIKNGHSQMKSACYFVLEDFF